MAAPPGSYSFHCLGDLHVSGKNNLNPADYGFIIPQTVHRAAQPFDRSAPDIIFPLHITVPGAIAMPRGEYDMRDLPPAYKRTIDTAETFGVRTIQLHLNMPGFAPWCTDVHVRDVHEARKVPIVYLMRRIARAVEKWHKEHERVPWQQTPFGNVAAGSLDNIVLIELRQVSENAWQPVLGWRAQ
ncbi:hypothetical protein PsYK624_090430 [Phanerochaete sordida]|uniref:Uncharacterized protein n=1 Tax=Phanerochaete sordida TaxID=48140 RepID=A0A9P3GDQ7_9APHY|nr:hypothetical protein PsYK624_090430 [Phanerochaete sordida]